jgi:hypothetical protein
VSHDCDCDSCQATDSRWAPHRATQRALKEDCPFGRHVADLLRGSTSYVGGKRFDTAEWWCLHCRVLTDAKGKVLKPKYKALDDANKIAEKMILKAVGCLDHKRYKVKRKPRSSCEACWRLWLERKT